LQFFCLRLQEKSLPFHYKGKALLPQGKSQWKDMKKLHGEIVRDIRK
jgi:hypothetical protein